MVHGGGTSPSLNNPEQKWPLWGRGVTDLRPWEPRSMVAGRQLRHALAEAMRIIRMTPCEHKIGICRCPYERFHYYQEPDSSWSPWLMALLASTATREAASVMEASLILQLETNGLNIENNRNWTTSCDYGGEGPNRQDEAHLEQYVYLAVKPLPLSAAWGNESGCISPDEAHRRHKAEPFRYLSACRHRQWIC